jgi:hypothetical protein
MQMDSNNKSVANIMLHGIARNCRAPRELCVMRELILQGLPLFPYASEFQKKKRKMSPHSGDVKEAISSQHEWRRILEKAPS